MTNLDVLIPYQHFKMECLYLIKNILQAADSMCKIDPQNVLYKENGKEKYQFHADNFHMANRSMVASAMNHLYSKTRFETTPKRLTRGSIRKTSFINNKSETITSRVEGFFRSLEARRISERDEF